MRPFKKFLIPFLIIFLLFLRFFFLLKSPLYLDEGIYLSWASLIHYSADFAYFSLQDGKTPLFFWFLSVVGPALNNYLLAGRLISTLAGIVTAFSWMIIFYKNFNLKKSIIFLILFLVAPYGILIERMALVDSLLMAFASLSLMFLILSKKILNENFQKKWLQFFLYLIFSGISLGFAYATKTTAKLFFVIFIAINIFWFLNYLKSRNFKKIFFLILGVLIFTFFYNEIISYIRIGGHVLWTSLSEKESLMVNTPKEIIEKLFKNPQLLNIPLNASLITQYLGIYLSGFLLFVFVGLVRLFKIKENQKFLWLIFYAIFSTIAICLSGKVMSSRYLYVVYPVLIGIAVFGVDYLLSLNNYKIKILTFPIFLLVFIQSSLLIFTPEKAIYSQDDQGYFVKGNLTAIGLPKVIKFFEDKDKTKILVGVSGIWGIPEGTSIILKENGINSTVVDLNKKLKNIESKNKTCDKNWQKIGDDCWQLDFGQGDTSDTIRYLYVVDRKEYANNLIQMKKEVILQFDRPDSENKAYLLKI